MRAPLACLLLLLAACGGPRQPVLTADQAMAETRRLDVVVVQVFDAVTEVTGLTQGSHLIEVRVAGGAPEWEGRVITLPYDEWAVGRPPPARGTRLRLAPREWLVTDPASKGRPIDGWNGAENHRELR
jgi:hypothetical protein